MNESDFFSKVVCFPNPGCAGAVWCGSLGSGTGRAFMMIKFIINFMASYITGSSVVASPGARCVRGHVAPRARLLIRKNGIVSLIFNQG